MITARTAQFEVHLDRSISDLTDLLFGPPRDHFGFLRYCWRRYGTGRFDPDPNPSPLDCFGELAEDLVASDLEGPRRKVKGEWPLPWPEFTRRARVFVRLRADRAREKRRRAVHDLERDWLVDGLTDEELAKICDHLDQEPGRIEPLSDMAAAAQEALDQT